jgi:hypothetical protein
MSDQPVRRKHVGGIQSNPEYGSKDVVRAIRTWSWLLSYLSSRGVNITEVCNDALLAEYKRLQGNLADKPAKARK